MRRKTLTLIVLVMLLCLPLKAPAEEHTFAAGSLILPTDSFYQPEADGGVLEVYGLVYYLLNHTDTNGAHDITVYWVINQSKTEIDGTDLEIEVDAATPLQTWIRRVWSSFITKPTGQPQFSVNTRPMTVEMTTAT